MINKNFKKIVSGLLLSCNIMSFSGYAVDVLKEGNCGSNKNLKVLYSTGQKLQQTMAENIFKRFPVISEDLLSGQLKSFKDDIEKIEAFEKYFIETFGICSDVKKLNTIQTRFINSIVKNEDLLNSCIFLRSNGNTIPSDKQKEFEEFVILDGIEYRVLSNKDYKFINGLSLILSGDIKLETIEDLEEIKQKLNKKLERTFETDPISMMCKVHSGYIPRDRNFEKTADLKLKQCLNSKFSMSYDQKRFKSWGQYCNAGFKSFLDKIRIMKDVYNEKLVALKDDKSFAKSFNFTSYIPKEYRFIRQTRNMILTIGHAEFFHNIISQKELPYINLPKCTSCKLQDFPKIFLPVERLNDLVNVVNKIGNGMFCVDTNRCLKIKDNPKNYHLPEHFKSIREIEQDTKFGFCGKFNVPGSIFEKASNISDLLDTSMDNKIIIVATYDVEKDGKNFKNYVFYIYDYEKYGFVKTGDVYSKLDNKWHPAYALMFVTDENNDLVTVHPRYM